MSPINFIILFLQCLITNARISSMYTMDFTCKENRCLNPIFPAFKLMGQHVLEQQETRKWQCITEAGDGTTNYPSLSNFCGKLLDYDFSIPLSESSSESGSAPVLSVSETIETTDNQAIQAYVSHVDGIGMEIHESKQPWDMTKKNPCVHAIWRMVCYTYYPKCGSGNQKNSYLRPCKSSCENYLQECNVKCCDESSVCLFERPEIEGFDFTNKNDTLTSLFGQNSILGSGAESDDGLDIAPQNEGKQVSIRGYIDHPGPSLFCTGKSSGYRRFGNFLGIFFFLFLSAFIGSFDFVAMSSAVGRSGESEKTKLIISNGPIPYNKKQVSLSTYGVESWSYNSLANTGTEAELAKGAWMRRKDFTFNYQVAQDPKTQSYSMNSCANPNIPDADKCSGHGICLPWYEDQQDSTTAFHVCKCNNAYAGTECRIKRKSKLTAYAFSACLGWLGFDSFYLGDYVTGIIKMISFGGCGILWAYDIIRISSGNIYAANYRLESSPYDVLTKVMTPIVFVSIGMVYTLTQTNKHIRRKRKLETNLQERLSFTDFTQDVNYPSKY